VVNTNKTVAGTSIYFVRPGACMCVYKQLMSWWRMLINLKKTDGDCRAGNNESYICFWGDAWLLMAWTVNKRKRFSFFVFSGKKVQYNSKCLQLFLIYIKSYSIAVDDGKSTKFNVSRLGGKRGDRIRRRAVSCRRNGWIVVVFRTKLFPHKQYEFMCAGLSSSRYADRQRGMVWYDAGVGVGVA